MHTPRMEIVPHTEVCKPLVLLAKNALNSLECLFKYSTHIYIHYAYHEENVSLIL